MLWWILLAAKCLLKRDPPYSAERRQSKGNRAAWRSISKTFVSNSTMKHYPAISKSSAWCSLPASSTQKICATSASIPTFCQHSCWHQSKTFIWTHLPAKRLRRIRRKLRQEHKLSHRFRQELRKLSESPASKMSMVRMMEQIQAETLIILQKKHLTKCIQLVLPKNRKLAFMSYGQTSKEQKSITTSPRRSSRMKQPLCAIWWTWQPTSSCTSTSTRLKSLRKVTSMLLSLSDSSLRVSHSFSIRSERWWAVWSKSTTVS